MAAERPAAGHPLAELTLTKVRELPREPEALFWVFVFPLLMALALGVAFRDRPPEALPVAVQAGPGAEPLVAALDADPGLRAELLEHDRSAEALRTGKVALVVVCVLGGLTFGGLGLLVAARPRTIEGVSGLMNLVLLPMWVFSGTFFSTSRFPDAMQPAIAGAWGAGSFALALAVFRWT